jgi:outer membrane protein insertion porin family
MNFQLYSLLTKGIFLAFFIELLTSCDNTRYLQSGQTLHYTTLIEVKDPKNSTNKELSALKLALLNLSRPKPNKRIGPIQLRLNIYNYPKQLDMAYEDIEFKPLKRIVGWAKHQLQDTSLNVIHNATNFLKRKIGEPPVVIDTSLLQKSSVAMQNYLFDKGYFYNSVRYETETQDLLTNVKYQITLQEKPFTLDTIFLPHDSLGIVAQKIKALQENTLLKKGDAFNAEKLQQEATRLATALRNDGFYDFAGKYFNFQLDSMHQSRTVNLYISLRQSPETQVHTAYQINNIYLYASYQSPKDSTAYSDTLLYKGYHYIYNREIPLKPQTITEYLRLAPNTAYSAQKHEKAINSLQELGMFKFVNIRFEKKDSAVLDCHIYLTAGKKQQLSAETELSNRTGGYIGSALKLGYKKRNAFKGAETIGSSIFGGIDFTPNDSVLINTINASIEFSFSTPKFLVPFKPPRISREYRPHTNILVKAALQRRVGFYTINSYSLAYGFDWYEVQRKRHILNPVSFNLVSINNISPTFQDLLNQNDFLRLSFESQFIIGINHSFIYSSQTANPLQSFSYVRINSETAGNLTSGIDRLRQSVGGSSDPLKLFGTAYSQFARLEADFRRYHIINDNSSFVTRLYGGIGIPYGNSDILPYAKQFFTGGPNSVRAFQIRSIGPGSDSTDLAGAGTFDRTGDMKLEMNAEYRFDIFYLFKGAVFLDAGNVWTVVRPTETNDAQKRFKAKDFLSELGIGTGIGMRLDFSYFVMRFDIAVPLHNPTQPKGKRWVIENLNLASPTWRRQNLLLNLAIGYPF